MHSLEKYIYNSVKSKPRLKNAIRNIYQSLFDVVSNRETKFKVPFSYKEGYFFGFHDLDPFSVDDKKVLCCKPRIFLRMPLPTDELEVGFFNLENGVLQNFVTCGFSRSWNHHKGCRLQWLSEDELIYNNHKEGVNISSIYNIKTSIVRDLKFPIDTVHKSTMNATSFSYERLECFMPGYGYQYKDDSFLDQNMPSSTGVYLLNLISGQRDLLISLQELANQIDDAEVYKYRHFVTHSEFSPDGKYISFLHRWVGDDILKRATRLVIYNLENKIFYTCKTNGMVSHYVWNDRNQILAYCNIKNTDGHVIFDIPKVDCYNFIAPALLNSDGHQSFITSDSFVTDTYPDKFRKAKLYLVDVKDNCVKLLASVYSPKKYQSRVPWNHIACDLHPRVSKSGKYISIDTVFTGIRSFAILKIK